MNPQRPRLIRYLLHSTRAVVAFTCMFLSAWAGAQAIPGYPTNFMSFDPREVALLPGYCKYTHYFKEKVPGGADTAERQRWFTTMGPIFDGMQHYCFGLMKTNRAVLLAKDEQVKQFYLRESIPEFDFVIDRAPEDFLLLPEILTKKGENLLRLNRAPLAIIEFEHAAQLKPDYWPPFALMSDYYKKVGDAGAARRWLERGLEGSPNADPLIRRLRELDASSNAASNPHAVKQQ